MTINLAQSMSLTLKATCNLPSTTLVKSTHFSLGTLFGKIGHDWTKMLGSGQVYNNNCMKGIKEEVIKFNSHNFMQFDRQKFCFLVQETVNHNDGRPTTFFNVDLRNQTCECVRFQTFHVPFSHVIATCSSIRQDYFVHIVDVFKVVNIFKVYKESFLEVLTETT